MIKKLLEELARNHARNGVLISDLARMMAPFVETDGQGGPSISGLPKKYRRPFAVIPDDIRKRMLQLREQKWTIEKIAAEVGISPTSVSRLVKKLKK